MKHITRWTPDTHDCSIEYEWDDSVPVEQREHKFVKFIKEPKGTRFDSCAKNTDKYEKVLEENQRRNKALGEIIELAPRNTLEITIDEDDNEMKRFKKIPKCVFDDDGNIEIEIPTNMGSVKNSILSKMSEKFNAKVRIK